ncbi:hypothetical protein [Pontibacter sp. G13]|uniref:hypothetical protein n=1 Tax=Pontibacter sp. G13 TaxID=3074898 RepID=UPI00288BC18E|nr:hypothetical protein [Pontibacter sp. G13]WNJ19051.1 hypothetical protein RJD25_01050 [Pontibacter sp. G13]
MKASLFFCLWIIVLAILPMPSLSAQVSGDYINFHDGSGITLTFKNDQRFSYSASGGSGSLVGTGIYSVHGDTLTLSFEEFVDTISAGRPYALIEDGPENLDADSLDLDIQVIDCHTGDSVGYPIVSVWDSLSGALIDSTLGNRSGGANLSVPIHKAHIQIWVNGPDYEPQQVELEAFRGRSAKVEVGLCLDRNIRYMDAEEVMEFQMLKVQKNRLKLASGLWGQGSSRSFLRIKPTWSKGRTDRKVFRYFSRMMAAMKRA